MLTDNRPNLSPQSCRIAAQPPPQPCIDSTPHLYPVSCRHAPTHQPFSWRVGCRSILGWCSATTTTTRRRAPLLRTWCKGRSPQFIKTRSMLAALPIAQILSRTTFRSCAPRLIVPRARAGNPDLPPRARARAARDGCSAQPRLRPSHAQEVHRVRRDPRAAGA